MADYLIKGQTLTDIADAIRSKTGTTDGIEADEMATKISQIAGDGGVVLPDLTNSATASDILLSKEAIDENGNIITGTMPTQSAQTITPGTSDKTIASGRYLMGAQTIRGDANLLAKNIKSGVSIFGVEGTHSDGVELPTLSNEGSETDMLYGKQLIDQDGNVVTGTIPTKTESNLTSSGATVTVPAGYYASQATKTIASGSAKTPTTTVTKNPTISVDSSGLITASVSGTQNVTPTVSAGYVSSGTAGTITVSGSATKQLTVQAAQTITPGTSNKTIASGKYLTGTQTIKGDSNLVAGNIKSGVSIFGVAGAYTGEDLEAVVSEQAELIEELSTVLDGKASGGEQATPEISVSTNGLITATAGTKSSTYQLAFQAAKTITPGTTNQTAVAANTYVGGAITVKGDANLIAANIVSGKSIFGVSGTATTGGGGSAAEWSKNEDAIVKRTILNYTNDRVGTIGDNAFEGCYNLTTISLPACTTIGGSAFRNCSSLTTISFPACTTIGNNAFNRCSNLTVANFPLCKTIVSNAFNDCCNLITISFPVCTSIGNDAFRNCSKLTTISFPACTTIGDDAFSACSKLANVSFPVCTSIGNYAFSECSKLTTISFPACTTIGYTAFARCYSLTTVNFPVCTSIRDDAFAYCSSLTTISFPACTTIGDDAFAYCSSLTTVNFPVCTSIGRSAFQKCYNLTSLYLTGSTICTLSNSNAFSSTPIGGYSASAGKFGTIYVPASLLTAYQTATNWTYFSSRFSAIESYSDPSTDPTDPPSNDNINTGESLVFSIGGEPAEGISGMTWRDWCNSDYNFYGFEIDGNSVTMSGQPVCYNDFVPVSVEELIIADYEYQL